MTTAKQLRDLGKRLEVTLRQDESGQLHPFYAYSIPDSVEQLLELAGKIQGTKTARENNVKFFKDEANQKAALEGMRDLKSFYISECRTQSTPGPNRGGKTQARIQKCIAIAINHDPLRPGYRFPFDDSKGPIIIWSCVPAKNTRQELMDLQRRIPPGYKFRTFTAKGDERIEIDTNFMETCRCLLDRLARVLELVR